MYTLVEGKIAVEIARSTIESHLGANKEPSPQAPERFNKKSGVFVTLKTNPDHDLRGCIGFPEPTVALIDALRDSAISAATRDPRFPPVRLPEMDNLLVEVSLLTSPEPVIVKNHKEYLKRIQVGRDGLIIQRGPRKGLLLPQVPVEQGWDIKTYLENLCWKAGIASDGWMDRLTTIWRFEGQVFSEKSPRGPVVQIPLKGC